MTHKEDDINTYRRIAKNMVEAMPEDGQGGKFGELISLLLQADAADPNAQATVVAYYQDLEQFFNVVDAEYAAWFAAGMPEGGLDDPIDLSTL